MPPAVGNAPVATLDDLDVLAAEARQFRTNYFGCGIAWRCWGYGPALVLLHGGHGSWTHWVQNIRHLAQDFTVLVPDIPGMGDSDTPPDDSIAWIGSAILHGLNEIHPQDSQIRIAGFSFGSIVGGELARLLDERTALFVLVGGSGLGVTRNTSRTPLVKWRHLESAEAIREANRTNLKLHMFHDPSLVDELAVSLQVNNTRNARLRSLASRGSYLRDRLEGGNVPLAGIWGENDITSLGYLEERRHLLRELDDKSDFVVIPNVGHWVAYEAWKPFNATLTQVLVRRL